MSIYEPSEDELQARLGWFVQLRWTFLLVLSLLILFAVKGFNLTLPLFPILLIASIVLVYNCVFFLLHKVFFSQHTPSPHHLRIEANLQIGLDLLALIFMVYFSGGIENPFLFFAVFHMILGSILLTGRDIWYQAIFCFMLASVLVGLSWFGIIPYYHIEGFTPTGVWYNIPFLIAIMASFAAIILLTIYMTNSISRSLHRRSKDLFDLTLQLDKKGKELEEVNEELVRQQNLLIQSEKLASLGNLSAGIAHELNSPLTGILNFSHFIKEGCPDQDQVQKDIDIVIRETDRCKKIIKGLLDFARQSQPEKKCDDIISLLNKTLNLVIHHKDFRNIKFIKNFPDDLPQIMFDTDQIQQVFMNLIVNAQQAMTEGGTLKIIAMHREEQHVLDIVFEDTGPGISQDNIQKIFDPFYTTKDMGTGLGLSISLGIIENHGGKLIVESDEGMGAVFVVRLPVQ